MSAANHLELIAKIYFFDKKLHFLYQEGSTKRSNKVAL
ncbi:putative uncharacterized protein [Waddlia chondrophila 2032/99]|uniref:Uncharacterized protein n=1 Tax=Waddlia chondrophila 2032/99 TaxID=765953 RepID=F8LC38_9BACT|nr:putative uncharacterized protein [Waddlia chondrophila 2032/99]